MLDDLVSSRLALLTSAVPLSGLFIVFDSCFISFGWLAPHEGICHCLQLVKQLHIGSMMFHGL